MNVAFKTMKLLGFIPPGKTRNTVLECDIYQTSTLPSLLPGGPGAILPDILTTPRPLLRINDAGVAAAPSSLNLWFGWCLSEYASNSLGFSPQNVPRVIFSTGQLSSLRTCQPLNCPLWSHWESRRTWIEHISELTYWEARHWNVYSPMSTPNYSWCC